MCGGQKRLQKSVSERDGDADEYDKKKDWQLEDCCKERLKEKMM